MFFIHIQGILEPQRNVPLFFIQKVLRVIVNNVVGEILLVMESCVVISAYTGMSIGENLPIDISV